MDSVQAILTVLGYKANQGGQGTLDGCWEQEQEQVLGLGLELELGPELGPEQGLELELELVAGEAGTGCLASKAGRAALEPELDLEEDLELGPVQGPVLKLESRMELTSVQGWSTEPVVSQASRVCLAGQSSMAQAGWAVLAIQGTHFRTVAGWAKGC